MRKLKDFEKELVRKLKRNPFLIESKECQKIINIMENTEDPDEFKAIIVYMIKFIKYKLNQ